MSRVQKVREEQYRMRLDSQARNNGSYIKLEVQCMKFLYVGWGSLQPSLHPLTVEGALGGFPTDAQAAEAPTIAATLSSREPDF